ncbi:MAG: DNA polymerase I [Coriobacteriia bacterium]|nr:DNA polymerase I [Coriobacteriia bacterium]
MTSSGSSVTVGPAATPRTIAIIDGNSLMHRAFHAVPPYMTAPDGRPTNACFGFLSMFLKLVEDFAPSGIVCAFDHGIPAFRLEAIEQYKAQRPPMDPDLKEQFPIIKELLTAMNIPVIELDGWEGDDILGTLAEKGEREQLRTLLVSGDKDVLQLVSEQTSVVNTRTGMSDVIIYDPPAVFEKWGVTPAQVPDFLGLMGDSSDNIPGVPGVGPKTATKLLQEYSTLEEVLANAQQIKGKLGENIRDNVDKALASRMVATIRRDVPLECDLATIEFPSFDPQQVKQTFQHFELNSQLKKILSLVTPGLTRGLPQRSQDDSSCRPEASHFATTPLNLTAPLQGDQATQALTAALKDQQPCAVFFEASGGASLFETDRTLYVAFDQTIASFQHPNIEPTLKSILHSTTLVAHDTKAILQELLPKNRDLPAAITPETIDPSRIFDVGLAVYLLDSTKDYSKTDDLLLQFYPHTLPTPTAELPQGAINVAALLRLHTILSQRLAQDASLDCYNQIELPLVPVLLQMERWGVNVDPQVLKDLSLGMEQTIATLKAKATAEAGEEFNLDSPKQLGVILFEKLRLPTIKKTRTGYSTDASVLQELIKLHPLPAIMLEYRELAKLKSTYLDALPQLIASDGHIHTSFNQTITATGRLSSSDPNLQNIPVRTELGRQIRTAFIPNPLLFNEKDAIFLSADYSQIELRLLAHLSGDAGLIEAFAEGTDFHAATAARVFGVPLAEMTPQLRSRAKAVNFGIVYGQQAFGLSQSLGVSFAEAQEMIARYFKAYPQVRRYLDDVVAQAHEQGWVATLYGRKRHINELKSSNANLRNYGERTAMNHPMQGSAADIIKLAMIEVQRRLTTEGLVSQMILQVHDELDFNCATSETERLTTLVKETMEGIASLKVPLVVDVTTGPNWALAH